jgi:HlyD family secretion protein
VSVQDSSKPGFRLGPRAWTFGLLLVGVVAGWIFYWQQARHNQQRQNLDSQTAIVTRQDVIVMVSASGSIRPITPVNVSPKQPGRIISIGVDQGDRVTAGQTLARMDDSNLRGPYLSAVGKLSAAAANLRKLQLGNRPQEIRQARENLNQAQAEIIAVRSTYLGNLALYQAGALGRVAFDGSRSQYLASQERIKALQAQLDLVAAGFRREDIEVARAQVLQARGDLQTIKAQLNDTVIRAPFAGVITQKYADVGAFVTPTTSASATSSATSSSIFALAGQLEGLANVSETDIGSIYPGQPVQLQVDAYPGRIFHGKVRLIAPDSVVVQNVTSFQVRITLPDQASLDDRASLPDQASLAAKGSGKLISGMNFTASFVVGRHLNSLLIPTPAIVTRQGGLGVYLPAAGASPRFQPVRVGATVGTKTEVLAGLSAGQKVLITFPGQRSPNDKPVRASSPFQPSPGGGRGIR